MYGEGSFKKEDMIEMMGQIRAKSGQDKIAVFWDNCRIHVSNDVKEAS